MNPESVQISGCADSECEKCKETKEDTVSITVESLMGTIVLIYCEGCISDAVSAAAEEGLTTEMVG